MDIELMGKIVSFSSLLASFLQAYMYYVTGDRKYLWWMLAFAIGFSALAITHALTV